MIGFGKDSRAEDREPGSLGFATVMLVFMLITTFGITGTGGKLVSFVKPVFGARATSQAGHTGESGQTSAADSRQSSTPSPTSSPPPAGGSPSPSAATSTQQIASGSGSTAAAAPTPLPSTPAPPPVVVDADGRIHYSNRTYGFSFAYPAIWGLQEEPNNHAATPDYNEFTIQLYYNPTQRYSQTAALKEYTSPFATMEASFDSAYAPVTNPAVQKQSLTVNGRHAVLYTTTGSSGISKLYLLDAGSRTYSFQSANERINEGRLPTYWADFDAAFASFSAQ